MRPTNLIALGALAFSRGVFGALKQVCAGFDTPVEGYDNSLIVKVGSKAGSDYTSVLMYRMDDEPHTNIPLMINDDSVLNEEPFTFGICTDERVEKSICEAKDLNKFVLTLDAEVDENAIKNVLLSAGETLKMDAKDSGFLCAIVYQNGDSIKSVDIQENHWWGHLPIIRWESFKVEIFMFALLTLSFVTIRQKFGDVYGTIIEDVAIFNLLAVVFYSALGILDSFLLMFDVRPSIFTNMFIDPYTLVAQLYNGAFLCLCWKVSVGKFGFDNTKPLKDIFDFERKMERMMTIFSISAVILTLHSLLLKIPIAGTLTVSIAGLVNTFVSIPLIYTIWKNSKATESSMESSIARKYHHSRHVMLWTPLLAVFLTIFSIGVLQLKTAGPTSNVPSQSITAGFIGGMKFQTMQSIPILTIKHLPDLSILVIISALIAIWKDTPAGKVAGWDASETSAEERPVQLDAVEEA